MNQEDKVSTPHPAYGGLEVKRDVYRAVSGGTDTMRAAATTYLPKYPAEVDTDYKPRLASATIDGIVASGVDTLTGSVFEGEIVTDKVAPALRDYLENIDNKGNSFNIFARNAFHASFEGTACILVDMPQGVAKDAAEDKAQNRRPYMSLYTAGNVINWRYAVNPVTKKTELVLLVLKEVSSEPKGEFGVEDVTRYRVFRFADGKVTWELWKDNGKGKEPTKEDDGNLTGVTGIPVSFIGAVTDDPKLLVESRLEIKAYQKESSFDIIEYLSIPTLCIIGRDGEKEALSLGASTIIDVPIGGDVKYVQIDSAGHESLKDTIANIKNEIRSRVNQMVASASVQGGNDKTATQVVTEDRDKKARLIVWADELKDALETALMYMGQFAGLGEDEAGEIELRTKWVIAAEMADAMMRAQADAKAKEDNAKTAGQGN